MRFNLALILLLIVAPLSGKGQFVDSIKHAFTQRPTLDVRFGARNSFITTKHAKMLGIKAGLNYDNRVKVGVGYNWLQSNIEQTQKINTGETESEISSRLTFSYFSPYFEYVFFHQKKWEASIPVNVGLGGVNYKSLQPVYNTKKRFVLLYEPYMMGQYKFTRYTGIGFGVGYRLLLIGNNAINQNLNSPIYVLKFKVFFTDIYRDIWPNE